MGCCPKQDDINNEERYYVCRIMIYSVGILVSVTLLGAVLLEIDNMSKLIIALTFSLISSLFTLSLVFLLQISITYANYKKYVNDANFFNIDPNPQII